MISPFQTDEPNLYACDICGKTFDSKRKLHGHTIGAHNPNKRSLKGNEHPMWKPLEHGTNAGYQQEIRRGIPTCDKCRKAHTKYAKGQYDKMKDKP